MEYVLMGNWLEFVLRRKKDPGRFGKEVWLTNIEVVLN